MKYFLALWLLTLPMLAPAQVEKVEDLPGLDAFTIVDRGGIDNLINSDKAATVGSHLVYRAHVHRRFHFIRREMWIIDQAGNRRVEPDWGELHSLGNGRWLTEERINYLHQIQGLDPQHLERTLLFPAPARILGPGQNGRGLVFTGSSPWQSIWSTDGTLTGNERLIDSVSIEPLSNINLSSSFQALDGKWVFLTADHKAYITDGTRAGTRLLHEFEGAVELIGLTPEQAIFHFGNGLWGLRYEDGELYYLFDFGSQNIAGRGNEIIKANVNGRVLFTLDVRNTGLALWGTDGTFEGTQLLTPIPVSNSTYFHNGLTILGDKAYFFPSHQADTGCWETDGTQAGTRRFAPREVGIYSTMGALKQDDRIYLAAYGLHQYAGLWMLEADGQLTDCTPWPGYGAGLRPSDQGNQLVRAGQEHVYYQAYGVGVGRELHRTNRDGQTTLVTDLNPGVAWSDIVPLGQLGPWFYFVLNHDGGGVSLYRVRDDQPIPPSPPERTLYEWQQGLTAIWRGAPNSQIAMGTGLASGMDGGIYVSGAYNSQFGLASTNTPHLTQPDEENLPELWTSSFSAYFIAKLGSEDGKPAWMKTLDNALYSAGSTRTSLTAAPGDGVYFSASSSSNFISEALLLRIDSTGQERWRLNGSAGTQASHQATDAEGNLYVAMQLESAQAQFGGLTFDNPLQLQGGGGRWGMVKIRPDGTVAWARQLKRTDNGNQHNALNAMAIGTDGAIYLAYTIVNAPGSSTNCDTEDGVTAHIQLTCLAPDGSPRWERPFDRKSVTLPTALAINRQGLLLLSGFGLDDLRLGSFSITGNCTDWYGFVLTLSKDGKPIALNRVEGDEPIIYALRPTESGGYGAAGMLGHYPVHIPYPGLAGTVPYGNNRFREFFLRLYSEQHELLDEKRWYQIYNHLGPVPVDQNLIRLAYLRDDEFIFQHPYSGPLDTFAHSPPMRSIGHAIMRLSMEAPPPPPLVEDTELSLADIQAFPNPAIGTLTLYSPHVDFKAAELYLFNSLGQQVSIPDIAAFGPYRYLDVSGLLPGVYFLSIRQGKGWDTMRVVVHR